ncbi:class I SAM-dependent DNA methyltransferase [Roseobacteraceae bacterium NS-SX3]
MSENFLGTAFERHSPEATLERFDRWAATYDVELTANGYAAPGRVAAALWKHLPDPDAAILDFGCGTGLCGAALRLAGYRVIDGTDPSPRMLAKAQGKGIYRHLSQLDTGLRTPVPPGTYRAITACGVLSAGAAPPAAFDQVMAGLGRGGLFAFTYNEHALEDRAYTGKLNDWLDCSAARLLLREHGPHLPGIGLKSTVYVIEKA